MNTTLKLTFAAVVSALMITASAPALLAQDAAQPPRQITVTGEGVVAAEPDIAWINLGVTETAKTADEALTAMSLKMQAVLVRLQAAGIAPEDIQTGQLSLYPVYNSASYEGDAEVTGYTAATAVDVRVLDMAKLGGVLDAVVEDGANTFGGIRFDLSEPRPAMDEARQAAVADGRARAELFATAAGVTLGDLVTLYESGGYSAPAPMAAARMEADAGSVPVAAGQVNMTASVTMVFEITD